MSSVWYEFKIPDPSKPLPGNVPSWGPTCELVDFKPPALKASVVIGRTVDAICPYVGTYGMGGPGFFGLRLGDEWLVIAIWGAASWIQVDGRIVQDVSWDKDEWPRPWITEEGDELSRILLDQPISAFEVAQHSLAARIGERTLTITESPESRPIREGNKKPRSLSQFDDLRRAVFLSPTNEIWV